MGFPKYGDRLVLRLGNVLLGGRSNLGLTQEEVREAAGLTRASQPTVSKWEKGDQIEPLEYAVRLARVEPATQEALADLIGVRRVDMELPDEAMALMVRRLMVGRRRADWDILAARLDEILPALRHEDEKIAREDLARVVESLVTAGK